MAAIRSGVVPIAGLGTRMRPVSGAVPKALLPLIDADGQAWSVLGWILADLAGAGVERVCVVVSPAQRAGVEAYLAAAGEDMPKALPACVELVEQPRPAGFGDAVALARAFTAGEAFLLALGDHVHVSTDEATPAARQIVDAIDAQWQATFGVQIVQADELPRVGAFAGEPLDDENRRYRGTDFVEKPTAEIAAARLCTPGLAEGTYLAVNGIYAFGATVFDALDAVGPDPRTGERELAGAMAKMVADGVPTGLVRPAAATYDTGRPAGYAAAFAAVRACRRG